YIDTGLALAPNLSNLFIARLGGSTYPFRATSSLGRLRMGAAGLLFFKIDSEASLNIPSRDGTFLGGEIDVFADWRIASDVSMNVRYGVFFPGDAACCPDDPRHFFYVGFNYAF
ncbi:MAG: hypothetical protein ACYTE6_14545, partial [Planctomycetota bacterium]